MMQIIFFANNALMLDGQHGLLVFMMQQTLTVVFARISLTLTAGSTVKLCLLCWFMALFIHIIVSVVNLSTLETSASSK